MTSASRKGDTRRDFDELITDNCSLLARWPGALIPFRQLVSGSTLLLSSGFDSDLFLLPLALS